MVFSETTAVVFQNHCGRFSKPLRSFFEMTVAGIEKARALGESALRSFALLAEAAGARD